DLTGVDVEPAGDEHVLGAVHDVQVAAAVEAADIPGVQPAAAQGLRGRLGTLPVALHQRRSANADLADLVRGERTVLGVEDGHLHARAHVPARGEPLTPRAVDDVLLAPQIGGGHRRL